MYGAMGQFTPHTKCLDTQIYTQTHIHQLHFNVMYVANTLQYLLYFSLVTGLEIFPICWVLQIISL